MEILVRKPPKYDEVITDSWTHSRPTLNWRISFYLQPVERLKIEAAKLSATAVGVEVGGTLGIYKKTGRGDAWNVGGRLL